MILVLTSHPLHQVLQHPDVSRRLTKWVIELGEFDIKFVPRTAIKGQAIVDFMAEFTYLTKALGMATDTPGTSEGHKRDDEPTDLSNMWSLRTDSSSNVNRSGVGIILESPTREKISYALRLEFPASNNEAEYEVLLTRL